MKTRALRSALFGVVVVLGLFAALVLPSRGASVKAVTDPVTAARFELSIDGVSVASFAELAGIASGYEIEDMSLKSRSLFVPPSRLPPSVTLKRGLTSDMEVWNWHIAALLDVAAARKMVTLVMLDIDGKPVARYHLENAWPSKIEIGGLRAGASEVLMETVTIVCERIQRVAV